MLQGFNKRKNPPQESSFKSTSKIRKPSYGELACQALDDRDRQQCNNNIEPVLSVPYTYREKNKQAIINIVWHMLTNVANENNCEFNGCSDEECCKCILFNAYDYYSKATGIDISNDDNIKKYIIKLHNAFPEVETPVTIEELENKYNELCEKSKKPGVCALMGGKKTKSKIKKSKTQKVLLPKLRKITKKNKKHIYKLNDPQNKRILAIEEGINDEKNKTKKNKREAAIKKKARFNLLRIYRKNKDKIGCKKLTKDMRYMDKKYNLGTTKTICGGSKKLKKITKKTFLYNPDNPKKSFDVYINKNPADTIEIKYTTVNDVKNTIKKLENLYKTDKYPHKRIWQVAMILKVRLEAMLKHKTIYNKAKAIKSRFTLANRYFKFLKTRTKKNTIKERKKLKFNIK